MPWKAYLNNEEGKTASLIVTLKILQQLELRQKNADDKYSLET